MGEIGSKPPDKPIGDACNPAEPKQDPDEGGDPLAALESEKDWVEMPKKGRRPHARQNGVRDGEKPPDEKRNEPLQEIPSQRDRRQLFPMEPQDIGGAGIARAVFARIGQSRQAADQDSGRDGPDEIRKRDEQEGFKHGGLLESFGLDRSRASPV